MVQTLFSSDKKKASDYHSEMNGQHFEEYTEMKILPALPDKSLLVVDRASYHMRFTEESKNPSAGGWKKAEIINWLVEAGEKNQNQELDNLIIPELVEKSKQYRKPSEYRIDKILGSDPNKRVEVLRLPTKHCELNPIELIWAFVKNWVATNNTFAMPLKEMQQMVHRAFGEVTTELCAKCVKHVEKVEKSYFTHQELMDSEVRPFLVEEKSDDEQSEDSGSEPESDPEAQSRAKKTTDLLLQQVDEEEGDVQEEAEKLDAIMRQSADVWGLSSAKAQAKGCTCSDGCANACCCKEGISLGCSRFCKCKGDCVGHASRVKEQKEEIKCGCKGKCDTRACRCFKEGKPCSSRCKHCVGGKGACRNSAAGDASIKDEAWRGQTLPQKRPTDDPEGHQSAAKKARSPAVETPICFIVGAGSQQQGSTAATENRVEQTIVIRNVGRRPDNVTEEAEEGKQK